MSPSSRGSKINRSCTWFICGRFLSQTSVRRTKHFCGQVHSTPFVVIKGSDLVKSHDKRLKKVRYKFTDSNWKYINREQM